MNRAWFSRFLVAALTIFCALLFTACGEPEVHYLYHGDYVLIEGESFQVELTAIPEGHTAAEYEWSAATSACQVSQGLVSGIDGGACRIYAELTLDGVVYREDFSFTVSPHREQFAFNHSEIALTLDNAGIRPAYAGGNSENLTIEMEEPLVYGENAIVNWSSSADGIVNIVERGDGLAADVFAVGAGETDVKLTIGGNEAVCHVTVNERPSDPEHILQYLSDFADETLYTDGGTAFVCASADECTIQPEETYGGGGKYIVQVSLERSTGIDGTTGTIITAPDFSSNSMPLAYYPEKLVEGFGLTSLLPEKMRATSMEEVSYILRIAPGDLVKSSVFATEDRSRVQGWLSTVNIQLVDALTGEVLKTYETLEGRLENSGYVSEGTTDVISQRPSDLLIFNAFYKVLSSFWLEDYDRVVFYHLGDYESNYTFRYYGSGTVAIPEAIHIMKLYTSHTMYGADQNTDIKEFDLPETTEIIYCPGWSDYYFTVVEGSEAEKYCRSHEIDYELRK